MRPPEKIVQKDQWFPLSAHMINNLSPRGALHAAGKNGGRNDVRQRRLRQWTPAPAQGHERSAEQTGPESHAETFFQNTAICLCKSTACSVFDNASVACGRPDCCAGWRHEDKALPPERRRYLAKTRRLCPHRPALRLS